MSLFTKLLLVLFASTLLLTSCNAKSFDNHLNEAQKKTLRISLLDGACSATVVGYNTILTATHCLSSKHPFVDINGSPTVIVKHEWDSNDHSLLRVAYRFDKSAIACFSKELKISDKVFIIGNPGDLTNIYREGYFSGINFGTQMFMLQIWPGDSGSAIFNMENQIVGVVSSTLVFSDSKDARRGTFQITSAKVFNFTPEQLKSVGIADKCAKNIPTGN